MFNVHFERTRSILLISYSISIIRHAIIFPDYVAPTMTESESNLNEVRFKNEE